MGPICSSCFFLQAEERPLVQRFDGKVAIIIIIIITTIIIAIAFAIIIIVIAIIIIIAIAIIIIRGENVGAAH